MVTFSALLVSILALGACVPQVMSMWRSKSSGGQSSVGWVSACLLNLMLLHVNLVGLHAIMPAIGSVIVFLVCVAELVLTIRFRSA